MSDDVTIGLRQLASSATIANFHCFCIRNEHFIRVIDIKHILTKEKLMINPIELMTMHETLVIGDSEQFSWACLHEESLLASGRHFLNFRKTTSCSFPDFQNKFRILS